MRMIRAACRSAICRVRRGRGRPRDGLPEHRLACSRREDRLQVGRQAAAARGSARSDPADRAITAMPCPTSARRARRRSRPTTASARRAAHRPAPAEVLPNVDKVRIERAGDAALAGGAARRPTRSGRWSRSSGRRPVSSCDVEMPEAGVMETDWAENRAKIPQDVDPQPARQGDRQRLFDRRARQVPHAPGARRGAGHHRDLHQPPRHGRGLHDHRRPGRRTPSGSRARRIPNSRPRCCAG